MSNSEEVAVERGGGETSGEAPAKSRRILKNRDFEPIALPALWIALIILFTVLLPGQFLTQANISSMLSTQAVLVIVTLAAMIPLIVGDLDVSVGAVVGFSAMLIAILNVQHGWNPFLAAGAAVVAGILIGLFNGIVATRMKVDLLVVTLGTGSLLTGFTALISGSNTIGGLSQSLVNVAVGSHLFGISPEFYYAIGFAIVLFYILRYTPFGRRMLIVGQARDVAALSGIKVNRVRVTGLVLCSGLAGIAGILYVGTSGGASPTGGSELLLPAYAGAFLGATTITPGRFNAFGGVIAVYFLVTGITGLQLLGAQTWIQQVFYGGALVIAVSASSVVRQRRRRLRTAAEEVAIHEEADGPEDVQLING